MATGRVVKLIPGLAPQRSFIQKGWIADLVLVNKQKISDAKYVIIDGRIVVGGGKIITER
jgi:adenine deaminase